MQETEKPDHLAKLEARIAAARERRSGGAAPKVSDDLPGNLMSLAMRIGIEMVAAVVVSAGIGWLLDGWLGTRPWLMVAFFFLGAAAGMMTVYRLANGFGLTVGYKRPDKEGRDGSDRK